MGGFKIDESVMKVFKKDIKMLINKHKNDELKLKYLQVYEDFDKKLPVELIEVFKKVRNKVGERRDSFQLELNLNEFGFVDLVVNLKVKFKNIKPDKNYSEQDIVYYSNINLHDLIKSKKVDIPVLIRDTKLNNDKLFSIISHEFRHIYDYFIINDQSDMESFINSIYYSILKKRNKNKDFEKFLNCIYLSLEHELIARNTMLYENFAYCKCNRDVLLKEFKNTYTYKSLILLKNFDYSELLDLKYKDIINDFIGYFKDEDFVENLDDIKIFFEKWKKYFSKKSDEYLLEMYDMLDMVYKVVKESFENKKIRKVKDILRDIDEKL